MAWLKRRGGVNRRKRSRKERLKDAGKLIWGAVRRLVPALATALLILSAPTLVYYGWQAVEALPVFYVDHVQVKGHVQTTRQEILDAIGYTGPDTHILSVDPASCEARLLQLPWVKSARVVRELPSRVEVVVEERTVGGLVLLDQLYLADTDGIPFKPVEREAGLDQPIVTGSFGPTPAQLQPEDHAQVQEAFALMRRYGRHGLDRYDRLSEVYVDALTGYALVTERRGVRVLLGEDQMDARLSRLGQVFAELDRHPIAARTIRLDQERMWDRVTVELDGLGKDRP